MYLDMYGDEEVDRVRISDIYLEAMRLNTECVEYREDTEKLGGVVSVGPRNFLFVVLFGKGREGRQIE